MKKILRTLTVLLAVFVLLIGLTTSLSSFSTAFSTDTGTISTDTNTGTDGIFFSLGPVVDCSTSTPIYNTVYTTAGGGGTAGGQEIPAGVYVSGSGYTTTVQSGAQGNLYTQKEKQECEIAFTLHSCTDVACHPTGNIKYTPF